MTITSVKRAHHVGDYLIDIEFSDGASGVVDLRDTVSKYEAAAEIRNPAKFGDFHLDEWPTLVWPCGFDFAPECLYELLTGSAPAWSGASAVRRSGCSGAKIAVSPPDLN